MGLTSAAVTPDKTNKSYSLELTEKERGVVDVVRKLPWGKVTVFVEDNKIVRVELVQSIKL